jgi:hypothetical protein
MGATGGVSEATGVAVCVAAGISAVGGREVCGVGVGGGAQFPRSSENKIKLKEMCLGFIVILLCRWMEMGYVVSRSSDASVKERLSHQDRSNTMG